MSIIMSDDTLRKPANRPSRRKHLIDAAVELFSIQPWEFVTVADIVERAGMTPAAFYYHFSSREQLLEEVVHTFARTWVHRIESLLDEAQSADELAEVPVKLLDEVDAAPQAARIFFLSAATAPLLVERVHRDARNRLIKAAAKAIKRIDPSRAAAKAKVNGVSMVVLYETAVRAHLSLDEPYRTLGPRRFREELANLSRVTTG
jgi:AcrR family transcriptional regulator